MGIWRGGDPSFAIFSVYIINSGPSQSNHVSHTITFVADPACAHSITLLAILCAVCIKLSSQGMSVKRVRCFSVFLWRLCKNSLLNLALD